MRVRSALDRLLARGGGGGGLLGLGQQPTPSPPINRWPEAPGGGGGHWGIGWGGGLGEFMGVCVEGALEGWSGRVGGAGDSGAIFGRGGGGANSLYLPLPPL